MPAAAPKELDYAQKEQLREAFDLFDVDKSGAIDYKEFVDALARGTVSNAAMGKRGMQSKEAMGVSAYEMLDEQLGHGKKESFVPTVNKEEDAAFGYMKKGESTAAPAAKGAAKGPSAAPAAPAAHPLVAAAVSALATFSWSLRIVAAFPSPPRSSTTNVAEPTALTELFASVADRFPDASRCSISRSSQAWDQASPKAGPGLSEVKLEAN